jgi:ABC-type sugar transport system substrate-binding protein
MGVYDILFKKGAIMKKISLKTRKIEVLLMGLIFILFALGIYNTFKLTLAVSNKSLQQPLFHAALIYDGNDESNTVSLIEGISTNSVTESTVVDIYQTNEENIRSAFESSWYSGVGLIMLKFSNIQLARDLIIESVERGIKIVLIGNDLPDSYRDAYVGVNKYQLGKSVATLIKESDLTNKNIGLILGPEYDIKLGTADNSYLNSLIEFSREDSNVTLSKVEFSRNQRAELIVQDWIDNTDINLIICTDLKDSIRTVNTLIDLNETSRVTIIASGDSPELLEYINKGTILGSLSLDYLDASKKIMEIIGMLSREERVSSYVPIEIKVITKEKNDEK